MALDFALGKFGCYLMYNTYLNGPLYDYYISILGEGGWVYIGFNCQNPTLTQLNSTQLKATLRNLG